MKGHGEIFYVILHQYELYTSKLTTSHIRLFPIIISYQRNYLEYDIRKMGITHALNNHVCLTGASYIE